VVDSLGRPKAAYWALRRAFASRAVFVTDEGTNGVAVHLVNDGPEPVEGSLRLVLYRDREAPLRQAEQTVRVEARQSMRLWTEEVLGGFVDVGHAFRFGPPAHDLVVARWLAADGRSLAAPAFHSPLGRPSDVDPGVQLEVEVVREAAHPALQLVARRFAQAVSLDVQGARPRDDFFHLEPGVPHVVELDVLDGVAEVRGTAWPLNAVGPTRFGGQA
jgi:beta-mannosidase